ncbi:hypothetical protein QPK87_09020 [Kamptonema cortianum]|nr:hypothetical protein [Kamptonema cortianum]
MKLPARAMMSSFFFFVVMQRGRHAFLRIHEFLTVFGFLGEVDEHQSVFAVVAEAKVRHVPTGGGGQNPAVFPVTITSGPNEGIDF